MQKLLTLTLLMSLLVITFPYIEGKPHLTNFFMNKEFNNEPLSDWEGNHEFLLSEIHSEHSSDGESELPFSFLHDYPKGKKDFYICSFICPFIWPKLKITKLSLMKVFVCLFTSVVTVVEFYTEAGEFQ